MIKQANSYKQNSPDWYKWRSAGLGASDIPAVMGESPWKSRFELWGEKTGLLLREEPNGFQASAMKRGQDLEPKAREKYTKQTGIVMEPVNCEHDKYEFLRASLDGWSETTQRILEIKCPNKVDHALAKKGKVPTKYIPQIQFQSLLCNSAPIDYCSWDGIEANDVVIVSVPPDSAYQKKLEAAAVEFWKLIEAKTPPRVSSADLSKLVESLTKQMERTNKLFAGLQVLNDAFLSQAAARKQAQTMVM